MCFFRYTCITLPKFNSSPLKSYLLNRKAVFQPPFFRGMKSAAISLALHRSPQISVGFPSIHTHSNTTFVYKVLKKKSFGVILHHFNLYTIIYMLYMYIYILYFSLFECIYQLFSSHQHVGRASWILNLSHRCWGSQTEVDDLPPVPGLWNVDLLEMLGKKWEKTSAKWWWKMVFF